VAESSAGGERAPMGFSLVAVATKVHARHY
jgi:hypothetical protein